MQRFEIVLKSWPSSHKAAPFEWPHNTCAMDPLFGPCKEKAKAKVEVRVSQAQMKKNLQFAAESAENVNNEGSHQIHIFPTPAACVPTGLEGAGVRGR